MNYTSLEQLFGPEIRYESNSISFLYLLNYCVHFLICWTNCDRDTSIRSLGKMMSGIPVSISLNLRPRDSFAPNVCMQDFDTAKGRGKVLVDPFRESLYQTPKKSPGPMQILSYPWVYTKKLNVNKGKFESSRSGSCLWRDAKCP